MYLLGVEESKGMNEPSGVEAIDGRSLYEAGLC